MGILFRPPPVYAKTSARLVEAGRQAEPLLSSGGGDNRRIFFILLNPFSMKILLINNFFYPYGGAAKGVFRQETTPVGSFRPNAWGLQDMHGNVWELCSDWYDPDYYQSRPNPDNDPRGPSDGSFRIERGGGWRNVADECRSAARSDTSRVSASTASAFAWPGRNPRTLSARQGRVSRDLPEKVGGGGHRAEATAAGAEVGGRGAVHLSHVAGERGQGP
jgi:hypothetical protein